MTKAGTGMKVREEVLRLLMEEGTLSGGKTAESLGVSRTAVWKAVEELRREGIAIGSVHGGGYRLEDRDRVLSTDAVRAFLRPDKDMDVIFAGSRVDSTNTEALRHLRDGAVPPFVLIAGEQTRGRGRKGRSFYSPRGGLYMTVALPGMIPVTALTGLTAHAALCVCFALEEIARLKPGIKWINDIFLDGKKIAGILTEADVDAESGDARNIRVGIGINTGFGEAAEDCPGMAFLGIPALRPALAARIAADTAAYDTERGLDTGAYKSRSVTLGHRVRLISGGREHEGLAVGVDGNGALILDEDGRKNVLLSGDMVRDIRS